MTAAHEQKVGCVIRVDFSLAWDSMSACIITVGEAAGWNIPFAVVLLDFKVNFEPLWRSNRSEVKQ